MEVVKLGQIGPLLQIHTLSVAQKRRLELFGSPVFLSLPSLGGLDLVTHREGAI
jgi:hypothetical protein